MAPSNHSSASCSPVSPHFPCLVLQNHHSAGEFAYDWHNLSLAAFRQSLGAFKTEQTKDMLPGDQADLQGTSGALDR